MKKFVNLYGLLSFTCNGQGSISQKGEVISLPEKDSHVQNLVEKKFIKPLKTKK